MFLRALQTSSTDLPSAIFQTDTHCESQPLSHILIPVSMTVVRFCKLYQHDDELESNVMMNGHHAMKKILYAENNLKQLVLIFCFIFSDSVNITFIVIADDWLLVRLHERKSLPMDYCAELGYAWRPVAKASFSKCQVLEVPQILLSLIPPISASPGIQNLYEPL